MMAEAGSGPTYRPSRESSDCEFITKTSPREMARQPCEDHFGDMKHARRPHDIEADRSAGAGVQEQLRRWVRKAESPMVSVVKYVVMT